MMDRQRLVAVIGGGEASSWETGLAEEVGRELAKNNVTLICGGLGGIMEAACKGAVSEGGLTIGILPGDEKRSANPYVKILSLRVPVTRAMLPLLNRARRLSPSGVNTAPFLK